jgi:hypothetical protein
MNIYLILLNNRLKSRTRKNRLNVVNLHNKYVIIIYKMNYNTYYKIIIMK